MKGHSISVQVETAHNLGHIELRDSICKEPKSSISSAARISGVAATSASAASTDVCSHKKATAGSSQLRSDYKEQKQDELCAH